MIVNTIINKVTKELENVPGIVGIVLGDQEHEEFKSSPQSCVKFSTMLFRLFTCFQTEYIFLKSLTNLHVYP